MKRGWNRAVVLCLAGVVAGGCTETEEHTLPLPSGAEAPAEAVFSPGQLHAGLEWAESEVLAAPTGATRIGMLVDLNSEGARALLQNHIEVRGFHADGTAMAWLPAEVTYSEDHYLVARADPGIPVYAAQLRLPAEHVVRVAHITFAAVVPELQPVDAPIQPLATQQGALTVAQVTKPRSAWNAKPTKCTSWDPNKSRMAIHHTFTPPKTGSSYAARIRSIQAYHMDTRGWCDIGYHYLVTDDGSVWEGRPINHRGAHVANHNTGNIGVSFVGCFQSGSCGTMGGAMTPSGASLAGAADLLAALADQHGISLSTSKVTGHGQHSGANTSCPGDLLLSRVPSILDNAKGGGGSSAPSGGQSEGVLVGVVWDSSTASGPAASDAKLIGGAVVSISGGPSVIAQPGTAYWEAELPAGTWTIMASAPGYAPVTRTVEVVAGIKAWSSVGLAPVGTATPQLGASTTLRVRGLSGQALPDSAIWIDGVGTQLTDGVGVLQVSLPSGSTTVRAWAVDHEARVQTVQSGAIVDLMLQPEKSFGSAGVQGVIWDQSKTAGPADTGAVRLEDAIVLCSCGTARKARDGDAWWRFELPPGTHTFTAVAPGYAPASQAAIAGYGGAAWASIGLLPGGTSAPASSGGGSQVSPPVPSAQEACYPGVSGAWDLCFPLVPASAILVGGYSYPSGGPSTQYTPPTHFLDLDGVDTAAKLAPSFALGELMQAYKGRYAVYSPKTVAHWQAVRGALGTAVAVTSGYRSPGYNAGISGAATFSRHMYGDAADVTTNGATSLSAIKNACYAEGADFVQVYTSHVHCDWRNDTLDGGFWGPVGAGKPGAHPGHDTDGAEPGAADSASPDAWIDPPTHAPAPGDAVLLSAEWIGFDEGTPWVSWRVTGPGTALTIEPTPNVAFEVPTAGDYVVSWEVGGQIAGELVVHVE